MPILITNQQVSLEGLTDRLLTSRATIGQRAAAVRALQAANPGLTGDVAKGTPVVLPELPHLRVKLDVGTLVAGGRLGDVEAVIGPLPDAVAELAATAKARSTRLLGDLKNVSTMTGDAQVKEFLTSQRVTDAADRAKAGATEAAALATAFSDAAPRWREQLSKLRALLLRTG